MRTEKIEIPIEVIDNATEAVEKINESLGGIGKGADKGIKESTMKFTELSSAIGLARQGLDLLKKGYDFAREGAQLEFTRTKFDRLAQTIGTTGDALLNKLRPATRGTMSDMEMIAAATDVMSLGLVKNEKDAVRLTSVMSGLGMDMNQVVLALSNQTTMRFDQLGVSVDGFNERLKKLKASGLDANAAFTEAFLQQAEEQLQKVGHAADTAAGKFAQFEAHLKNIGDSIKEDVADAFLPVVEALSNGMSDAQTRVESFDRAAKDLGVTSEELQRRLRQVSSVQDDWQAYFAQVERGAAMTDYYKSRVDAVVSSTTNATMTQEQFNQSMKDLSSVMRDDLTKSQENYIEKMAELSQKLEEAKSESDRSAIIEQIQRETEAYNERATAIMFNIQQQAIMAAAESGQIDFSQASAAISALAEQYGLIDENQKKVMDATSELISQFAETGNIENFTNGLISLRDATIAVPEPIQNTSDAAQTFNEKLTKAVELIHKLPPSGTAWNYSFNFNTGAVITQSGAVAHPGTSLMPIPKATGGSVSNGWTLVGERGAELISPAGYVYTAEQTRALLSGGIKPKYFYAEGGFLTEIFMANTKGETGTVSKSNFQTSFPKISVPKSTPTSEPVLDQHVEQIVSGVNQTVLAQQVALQIEVNKLSQNTRETNQILMGIYNKVASDNDVARAIVEARGKFS
jgi:hypothetical protein